MTQATGIAHISSTLLAATGAVVAAAGLKRGSAGGLATAIAGGMLVYAAMRGASSKTITVRTAQTVQRPRHRDPRGPGIPLRTARREGLQFGFERMVRDDARRVKHILEAREVPRIEGQPSAG